MKSRVVMLLASIIVMVSCKTQCIPETIEVEREVVVTKHDTSIVTAPDSASLVALLQCDSNYNVVLNDLILSNGERMELQAKLNRNGRITELSVDCHEDSLRNYIEWLETNINEKRTETIVKVEKYTPPFAKFCVWYTIISWVLMVLAIALWAIKKFYLHM